MGRTICGPHVKSRTLEIKPRVHTRKFIKIVWNLLQMTQYDWQLLLLETPPSTIDRRLADPEGRRKKQSASPHVPCLRPNSKDMLARRRFMEGREHPRRKAQGAPKRSFSTGFDRKSKAGLASDDVRVRSHKTECESSCNPLHGVKVRVCPGNILGI